MSAAQPKPKPVVDLWNAAFYAACRQKRLTLQHCSEAGRFFFPPAPVSPFTGKQTWEWCEVSGRGRLWSFIEFHQNYFPGFADEIPYPVVMVELDEGPVLLTNLRGAKTADLAIGQRMRVVFDDDEMSLPQFAPEAT